MITVIIQLVNYIYLVLVLVELAYILAELVMVELVLHIVKHVVMELLIELLLGGIGIVLLATVDIEFGLEIVNVSQDFMKKNKNVKLVNFLA